MGDAIDFEAVRHRLKLLRETGESRLFENRDEVVCPVCQESFAEVLATTERTRKLSSEDSLEVCLVREPDRLVVFTHARERR